jgi:hypothetical protein
MERSLGMQRNRRYNNRITCISKCFLYHNGSKYSGVLENISISGALVSAGDSLPYVVQVGDSCNLVYCDNGVISPGEYPGTVVRLSSPKIGLQFKQPLIN